MISKINDIVSLARPVRVIKRFKKDEEGATAVEFALVGGPFFLLVFAIIETSLMFFANQYLETVIDDMARLYRTGQLERTDAPAWDLTTEQGFRNELCRRIVALYDCNDIIFNVEVDADFAELDAPPSTSDSDNFDDDGNFTPTTVFPPQICGEDVLQITAIYEWPVFANYAAPLVSDGLRDNAAAKGAKNNNALINVTAVVRTEDFPPPPGTTCT